MSISPVREALRDRLVSLPALTGLLSAPTAVHYQVAPQQAKHPLIVFGELDQRPDWAFAGPATEWDVWQVKAVTTSAKAADEIAEQIKLALDDAQLQVDGHELLYLRRRSGISYPEQDGATTYWHRGWQFRLITEPA